MREGRIGLNILDVVVGEDKAWLERGGNELVRRNKLGRDVIEIFWSLLVLGREWLGTRETRSGIDRVLG